MRHLMLCIALLVAILGPVRCSAEPPQDGERAVVLTLSWDGTNLAVDKTDRRETAVPAQHGFPQLWNRFFELQNKDGDVCYAGPVALPQTVATGADAKPFTFQLILPDLDEARHLVVYRRVSQDPDTGRKIILEKDL